MTEQEIIGKLTEVLAEEFEIEAAEITAESSLKDTFGLDSLDLVDVVVLIHDHFGIRLQGPDFAGVKTFGDFCTLIIRKLHESEA